jgi:Uma2 family endonuclease
MENILNEPAVKYNYLSQEEYLEAERNAEQKHELINGKIFTMAGASLNHNQIVANVLSEIHFFLKRKPCRVFPSDLRVAVASVNSFMYPDVTIVCDKPELLDEKFDTILNPSVVIEVLSPSTESHDRGTKFFNYQQIPSLKEYILVSSTAIHIHVITKKDDGLWKFETITDISASLSINTISQQILLSDVYLDVNF